MRLFWFFLLNYCIVETVNAALGNPLRRLAVWTVRRSDCKEEPRRPSLYNEGDWL